jgi:hypothetical protein
MTIQSNITITKYLNRTVAALLAVALCALAVPAFAHGGFDHVMGTVVKVSSNVVTVKTAKGDVDVKLDDKTELTKNNLKAQLADLTPGARVVIDIPEGSKDNIAHSVKIGTAAKAVDQHAHDH